MLSTTKHPQHSHAVAADYVSGKPASLMQTDSRVQYAPPLRPGEPGYLLFIRAGSLLAQPFDADRLRIAGEPFAIAQNVVYYGPVLSANFSVSANGVLVYQANFPVSELKWYDRSGKEVGQAGRPTTHWGQVRVSRDGQRVAATVWSPENGGTGIWIFDANGRESRRVTFPPEVHRRPVWSPDGTRLAFGRSPTVGGPELAILNFAGGAAEEFVNKSNEHVTALPTDWSWDGRFIALDDGVGEEQAHGLDCRRRQPIRLHHSSRTVSRNGERPSRRMANGSRSFPWNRAGRRFMFSHSNPRPRRTWWATGGRFRETAPGWCAGVPTAASFSTWVWTIRSMRCRSQGRSNSASPRPFSASPAPRNTAPPGTFNSMFRRMASGSSFPLPVLCRRLRSP